MSDDSRFREALYALAMRYPEDEAALGETIRDYPEREEQIREFAADIRKKAAAGSPPERPPDGSTLDG